MDEDKPIGVKEEVGVIARIDREIKEVLMLEGEVEPIPEEFIADKAETEHVPVSYDFEEPKKMSLYQAVQKMTVSQKISLAMKGNKEARGLLIRESNKLVACAVIRNPRITDSEALGIANSRSIPEEVIRIIMENREWMKLYQMKVALVYNPKTPLNAAMKLLMYIYEKDLKMLSQSKNVSAALATAARKMLVQKEKK